MHFISAQGTDGYPVTPRLPKGGRAPGDKRPNFVFYFPDTVAAESCGGLYGNPVVKTPFMDALAAEGTLFKQAHGRISGLYVLQ